jgi:hypothetical protein
MVPVTALIVALALPVIAGCSSAGSGSTTTSTTGTTKAGSSSTTSSAPTALPASGSVDGFTLSVTSSPANGTVGHTVIRITAVLKGTVTPSSLVFEVSDRAAADAGRPATDQQLTVSGPGTYRLPHPFSPTSAGTWASTVTIIPKQSGASQLSVSGLPPVPGEPSPFPQLVTNVTAA